MNNLKLVQKLCRKIGYDRPSTVEGLDPETDIDTTLVAEWISDSWVEIQHMCKQWAFMSSSEDINILQDKAAYTASDAGITDFKNWILDQMYLFDGSDYVKLLIPIDPVLMKHYQLTDPKAGEPIYFSEGSILELWPTPEQSYTLKSAYRTVPFVLEKDIDTPACPDEFHIIAFYHALITYAVSDASPEDVQYGELRYKELLNRLTGDQCPQVSMKLSKTVSCPGVNNADSDW